MTLYIEKEKNYDNVFLSTFLSTFFFFLDIYNDEKKLGFWILKRYRKITGGKSKQCTKKFKAIHNKLNEIETYIKMLKDIKNKIKKISWKPFFKPIIISKNDLDKFEERKLKVY